MAPATQRAMYDEEDQQLADALVVGTGVRGNARRRLKAAVHAVNFWTWRSLAVEQGLADEEAADLAAALLVGAASAGR